MQALELRIVRWLLTSKSRIETRMMTRVLLKSFRHVGKNLSFDAVRSFFSPGTIAIGDNVFIGRNAYMAGEISIGNNVMFGANPAVLAGDHIFAVRGKRPRFIKPHPGQNSRPIVIEDDVWIGANVTILGGIVIGMGAVVGAGSVVVKDICPFTISVGNPCQPVRRIFADENLLLHLTEIGYPLPSAQQVVQRRAACLLGLDLPIVDNTTTYPSVTYDVP
jgi:acetyltransferase-like isoleucine patch superfamily enzyme